MARYSNELDKIREATDDRSDYVQKDASGKWRLTAIGIVAVAVVAAIILAVVFL